MLLVVLGFFTVVFLIIFAFDELVCVNDDEHIDSFIKMIALADGCHSYESNVRLLTERSYR